MERGNENEERRRNDFFVVDACLLLLPIVASHANSRSFNSIRKEGELVGRLEVYLIFDLSK